MFSSKKENLYKYLLFFKKYAKSTIETDFNDGLTVNPAIEIILYSEKKIRDFDKNFNDRNILRTTGVKEKDYYEKFSLKKSLEEAIKEYETLSPILKRKVEKYNPSIEKIVDNNGKINENLLFYKLLTNDNTLLKDEVIEGIFNRYKSYKIKMSYSFFKSMFCLKNEALENLLFRTSDKFPYKEGYFSFLFKFDFIESRNKLNPEKSLVNYFSKMFFHLKNQFLNLHFSNISTIDKLHNIFSLNFIEKKVDNLFFVKFNFPNMFFPDLSIMNKKYLKDRRFVSNLPVFKFLMQRYYYIGEKNLSSVIYSMYFSDNEITKMFPCDKIKKDFTNYIRVLLKKSKPSLEDIENFKQKSLTERNRFIVKMNDADIIESSLNKKSIKGETTIPYIGKVVFERKKIEDSVLAFEKYYEKEGIIDNRFMFSAINNKSLYKTEDAKLFATTESSLLFLDFFQVINNLNKKDIEKEIER